MIMILFLISVIGEIVCLEKMKHCEEGRKNSPYYVRGVFFAILFAIASICFIVFIKDISKASTVEKEINDLEFENKNLEKQISQLIETIGDKEADYYQDFVCGVSPIKIVIDNVSLYRDPEIYDRMRKYISNYDKIVQKSEFVEKINKERFFLYFGGQEKEEEPGRKKKVKQ